MLAAAWKWMNKIYKIYWLDERVYASDVATCYTPIFTLKDQQHNTEVHTHTQLVGNQFIINERTSILSHSVHIRICHGTPDVHSHTETIHIQFNWNERENVCAEFLCSTFASNTRHGKNLMLNIVRTNRAQIWRRRRDDDERTNGKIKQILN